jgi:hypothetical protein
MKIQLGPEIVLSYKRLAYQAWYALAEFVDNSTQAYFNHKAELDAAFRASGDSLFVKIETGKDTKGKYVRIVDNSIGMSLAELEKAVYIGRAPENSKGRSRYGLGLKTGAFWFGDEWSVKTKKLGEQRGFKITVNVLSVAEGDLELPQAKFNAPKLDHGTTIEIRKLHRNLTGRTLQKCKDYLRSLYRRDISKGTLRLFLNGEELSWDADIDAKLLTRRDGSKAREKFRFKVGTKSVAGWAALWDRGSRKNAGFSVIQADRVITGWPDSYRPETIFGEQEGGSNDLVNQRLFGELELEGFEVSHTKDQILFDDGDQEELEAKLEKRLARLRQLAISHRKGGDERIDVTENIRNQALNLVEQELKSTQVRSFFRTFEVPKPTLIQKTNQAVAKALVGRVDPDLSVGIGDLTVKLYLADDMSPNDPYLIIEPTETRDVVIVIVNMTHPHWKDVRGGQAVKNFIRHCAYDGVAEAKAYQKVGKIEANTVKLIKDNLLRLDYSEKGE